jgi:hypothetical protein
MEWFRDFGFVSGLTTFIFAKKVMNHRVQRFRVERVQPMAFKRSNVTQYPSLSIFDRIPPERVGLNGEYDHGGLAKRVAIAFHGHFDSDLIDDLEISQRGCVVILRGLIPNSQLKALVDVALGIEGAEFVEYQAIQRFDQAA